MPALQVSCPNCGGTLELKAPDVTQRVACPFCNSLLDCTPGKVQVLEALEPGPIQPCIPLGAVGTLVGKSYTVIGFMVRHVALGGVDYPWREFLLYGVGIGFRWLVESDGHWNFVESVPPGRSKSAGISPHTSGSNFASVQLRAGVCRFRVGGVLLESSCGGESVVVRLRRSAANAEPRDFDSPKRPVPPPQPRKHWPTAPPHPALRCQVMRPLWHDSLRTAR